MSFSKFGIGDKQFELGKHVLLLSAIVIGAKAWNFDLSKATVLSIPASAYSADVVLGMIGLILWVALAAYFVARSEQTLDSLISDESRRTIELIGKDKVLLFWTGVTALLSTVVYMLPFVLGALAAWVVRHETMAALRFVVNHL